MVFNIFCVSLCFGRSLPQHWKGSVLTKISHLCTGHLPGLVHPEKTIQQGIPEEAFDIYCPDDELKTSLLQEFILLDEKYRTRLEKLEADHQSAIRSVHVVFNFRYQNFLYRLCLVFLFQSLFRCSYNSENNSIYLQYEWEMLIWFRLLYLPD